MGITLEQALNQKEENIETMPKTLPLETASKIDSFESIIYNTKRPNIVPLGSNKDTFAERVFKGAYDSFDSMRDIAPAIQLYGNTIGLSLGGYFGETPEETNRKKMNIATIQRNLANAQRERTKYTSPETAESLSYGLGQGLANLGAMYLVGGLAGGIAKGVGLSATKSLATNTAVGIATGTALENVEQQSERIPVTDKGEINVEKITPEWAKKSAIGTTAYLATSAILEKKIGFGKQKTMWQTPIKFSNKTLKNASPVLMQAGKGILSEGVTEGLQSLTSTGILLADGTLNMSALPERLQQAWKEAIIGGILGGSIGTAVGINQQRNVKLMLGEQLENVVADPNEREKIIEAIYDAGTNEMTTVISKELELSSQLNAKHGTIYNNMQDAITKAIKESGAMIDESETDIAQYVSETSKMFANQVLAEANKRNCLIDEVLKASDIAYIDGKIQLKAEDKVISETPAIADENNKKAETLSLSFYKNEILGYKFDKKNLETIKGRYKNKYYTKSIDSLSNGIIRAERDFNIIINEIYRNPAIIENSELMSKLEAQLEKITKSLPEEEEITNAFYENFWGAVNSASEYLNVKNNSYKSTLYQDIKPTLIELNSVPNFDTVSELKEWIATELDLLGNVFINANNRTVIFNKGNIGRSMKGIKRSSVKRNSYASLKELVENSYFIYSKEVDGRHERKNNGQEIYQNAFIYNNKIYGIEISVDIPKNKNQYYSYAGHKIKELGSAINVLSQNEISDRTEPTISINDIRNLFNPNVKILEQSAYHGTPHRFDEFSLEHIGTGEGAQAHGWGLYFAENKDVSEEYRKALIQGGSFGELIKDVKIGNFTLGHVLNRLGYSSYDMSSLLTYTMSGFQKENKEQIINKLNEFIELWESLPQATEWQKETSQKYKKLIKELERNNIINTKKGQLFEVDIPENDVLLDEDKKLNEQPEKVRKAIWEYMTSRPDDYNMSAIKDYNHLPNYDGEWFYKEVAFNERRNGAIGKGHKEASLLLNKLGIKGITYDGRRDGRCYVIFDDKAIKILNTFYQVKGLPKQEKISRGAFYVDEKAIELFKDADYSTLPHELAHFWLDNMWNYAQSNLASEQYLNNFNELCKWLGVTKGQMYLTTAQQEKFARGYEKYLMQGYAPNGLIQGAFDDYDKWLKRVYNSAKELKVKLTPQAIEFFDTMTTGELPEYTVEETQKELFAKNLEEAQKTVEETQKVIVEKQAEFSNTPINTNNIVANATPVAIEGEQKKSAVYTKQADILGVAESLNYNKVSIEEQNQKATEFVINNLQQAERIVKGLEEPPSDILKNAIFNAYLKQMLDMGNNEAYLDALRIQSLNLTRAGQEIASQRGAVENIFDSAFWIRKIETNAKIRIATNKYGSWDDETGEKAISKMNDYIEKEINSVLDAFLNATPEEQTIIVEKLSNKITSEFKVKKKKQENDSNILFQSLKEPTEIRTRTNAYNYLYKVIYGDLGISLTKEQANEVIAKTNQIQKSIETTKDKNGNPSALFFKNLSEMENYANSIQPSPALSILTSVVGRGNMLFSLKSLALNIESNILNFLSEATVKRVLNKTTNLAVDPEVIKDYMQFSKEVYKTSGYQISSMPELDPTQSLLSEKMITSQGEGLARALGRFFEQTIFKYGLGYPDVIFKDLAFTDTVNLLATQHAKGDTKKATEIFKDATLIEPKTEIGKQIREVAINDALIATYQNKGTISKFALDIRNSINKATGDLRLGDLLSPFVKTPANVIGIGLDYTVGGIFAITQAKTIINDVKNGHLTDDTKKAFRSLSRNGLGLFVAFVLASLIDDDDYIPDYALLTPSQRELVKLKGGVFNSIKIGDKYVSLDYFGTLGMPLVAILNARRGAELKEQVYNYFNGARLQAFKIPVLSDLKDLADKSNRALTQDADKNIEDFENWAIDFVSSRSIPAIISDVAKITDDYERNTNNKAINRLMAKIPIIREELPLVYNYGTGRPVETQNAMSTLFAGARIKEEISSPVIREINRLSKTNTENNVTITKITKTGDLSKLSDTKKLKIEKEFAKRYSKEVKTLLDTVKYKYSDNDTKVKLINKIRANIREDLKKQYGLSRKRGR